MKTVHTTTRKNASGFTLIEMIGVLAVIAILASLLVPKIFEAINNAKVNNAAVTCGTVKTALADHYAKFGAIPVDGSGATPTVLTIPAAPAALQQYDKILLKEAFLDKPFAVKIGDGTTNTTVQLRNVVIGDSVTTSSQAYNLSGNAGGTNEISGVVVEAVITGATENDAKDLNDRLDGPNLGVPLATATGDTLGRVKYAAPTAGTTTIYVYLTHR